MTLAARMGEAPKEEPAEAATLATLSSNPRPRRAKSEHETRPRKLREISNRHCDLCRMSGVWIDDT